MSASPPAASLAASRPRRSEAERRRLIADRQKTSVFWAVVHVLGSLKFAVVLLLTIAAAVGAATVVESRFDSTVAQYYVYRSQWFMVWLVFLVINLACAALTRWPWERRHTGFVVTHLGIIILLIGAMVGRAGGFEAFVTLRKGGEPQRRLVSKDTAVTVQTEAQGPIEVIDFPVEAAPPTEASPRYLRLSGSALRLMVDRFSDALVPVEVLVKSEAAGAPSGVQLQLTSGMMGQEVDVTLLGKGSDGKGGSEGDGHFDFFGRAAIDWVEDEAAALELLAGRAEPEVEFQEMHVVVAAHPAEPVISTSLPEPSGYRAAVDMPAGAAEPRIRITDDKGREEAYQLREVLRKARRIDGTPVAFQVAEYWPDFAVREGKPTTLSQEPKNPAVLVVFRGKAESAEAAAARRKPRMALAWGKEGKVAYWLAREGEVYRQGEAGPGETVDLGWADWKATVVAAERSAGLRREIRDFSGTAKAKGMAGPAGEGMPGIRARLVAPDGKASAPEWILAGNGRNLFLDNELVQVGFGRRTIPLPFEVRLLDFEVPRDEGTDTPSDFISTVEFRDPVSGEARQDTAHMNVPATYPGEWWRSWLGWNYKFSQAQWNPQDLDETSLQVLYDPGWPLKWVGSLLICLGIAVMFYMKPYGRKAAAARGGQS